MIRVGSLHATENKFERDRLAARSRWANPPCIDDFIELALCQCIAGKHETRGHPASLFEVKKPDESKYPWDYYKLVATIPPNEAFIPLEKSVCPLLKKS